MGFSVREAPVKNKTYSLSSNRKKEGGMYAIL